MLSRIRATLPRLRTTGSVDRNETAPPADRMMAATSADLATTRHRGREIFFRRRRNHATPCTMKSRLAMPPVENSRAFASSRLNRMRS